MIYEIQNEQLTVQVSDFGAELYSVRSKKDDTEYVWQGKPEYWTGRAPNLFPICGRLFGGSYTYDGKTHKMGCHGFTRDSSFTLAKQTADSLVFELCANDTTREQYPFEFVLQITFALNGNKLNCNMNVKNPGTTVLPFALGGHPGFNAPLVPGLKFDDYYIDFGDKCAARKLLFSETCFDTGNTAPFALRDGSKLDLFHGMFDHDAIFLTDTTDTMTLRSDKDSHSVTVKCPQMKYVGFWHKNCSDAPYICIEPWLGLPTADGVTDDFAIKPEMIRLKSGEKFDFAYDMIFG